jgi:glycerol-3-phosphate cytidylyltransferase-like family protein
VIVGWDELPSLQGRVTMVDGGFDPLHPGHIDYFQAAAELGAPVLCNVSPDEWILRKHPLLLAQSDRVALVDAIRFIDFTHASSKTTAEVLGRLAPRIYAKGDEWRGRLPQEELDVCAATGIEIVFLDTVSRSSTEILGRFGLKEGVS